MASGKTLKRGLVSIWYNPTSYTAGAGSVNYDLSGAKGILMRWRYNDTSSAAYGTVFLPIGWSYMTWLGGYGRTVTVTETGVSWSASGGSYPNAVAIPQQIFAVY